MWSQLYSSPNPTRLMLEGGIVMSLTSTIGTKVHGVRAPSCASKLRTPTDGSFGSILVTGIAACSSRSGPPSSTTFIDSPSLSHSTSTVPATSVIPWTDGSLCWDRRPHLVPGCLPLSPFRVYLPLVGAMNMQNQIRTTV